MIAAWLAFPRAKGQNERRGRKGRGEKNEGSNLPRVVYLGTSASVASSAFVFPAGLFIA